MTHLTRVVTHATWADRIWIDTIEKMFPDDQYLAGLMSHVLRSAEAWCARISGAPVDRDIWRGLSFVDMQTLHERHARFYDELLAGDLDRVVPYVRITGESHESPVSDILLHIALHAAHHRGQMATYASGLGHMPPNVDFIAFCMVRGL